MLKLKKLTLAVGILLLAAACQKDPINQLDIPNSENAILEINAAETLRACGMEQHMQHLLQDPLYQEAHQRKFTNLAAPISRGRAGECTNKVLVPVAVHYQRLRGSIDVQCLRDLAQDQIDILNADYGGTNGDISKWNSDASTFPGIAHAEACIEFKLANINHPSGYGLVDGDPAVTINETRGDSDRNWAGYLNIFVRNIQYLGYSPLGGDGDGDGVVIDDDAFGSGSGCGSVSPAYPYNLGRTLTHELGHYLLLDHIWGGGCDSDDGIADTPDSSGPYYGSDGECPELGVNSCDEGAGDLPDLHMNYMDYVYDACMYMFTAGQEERMEGYLSSALGVLTSNAANVIDDGGNPPPPPGNCTTPDNLSASVNKKKVNISWTGESPSGFSVQYRIAGTGGWTTKSTTTTSITLNGMKGGTYEYQVGADCEPGVFVLSQETFTVN